MSSPLERQTGTWWKVPVGRAEKTWLWLSVGTALVLFFWMGWWTVAGAQNPMGETYRVTPSAYRQEVASYERAARSTPEGLVPAGQDVYIGAHQWAWEGLPVVLQAGRRYRFHLSSYDVQHGFSVRPAGHLAEEITLQVLPGYEWVVDMEFPKPGRYEVQCNEFCGLGHRMMHGEFVVEAGGAR